MVFKRTNVRSSSPFKSQTRGANADRHPVLPEPRGTDVDGIKDGHGNIIINHRMGTSINIIIYLLSYINIH